MLLAVDVGNTQTLIGLYEGEELRDHWRIATNAERTSDELALMFRQFIGDTRVDGIAISSVVPRAAAALREMTERWFECALVVLEPGIRTGMPILYDNPREVGADRIANAIGTFDKYGGPAIVVDFGTSTNFDVISPGGEYVGGAIAPGVQISMDALFGRAAALRRVELVEPRNVIGKSTVESIQSGVLYGFAGQVDGIVDRIRLQLGSHATVVATGGLSGVIAPHSRTVDHTDPWLTLHGLRLVFDRNT